MRRWKVFLMPGGPGALSFLRGSWAVYSSMSPDPQQDWEC